MSSEFELAAGTEPLLNCDFLQIRFLRIGIVFLNHFKPSKITESPCLRRGFYLVSRFSCLAPPIFNYRTMFIMSASLDFVLFLSLKVKDIYILSTRLDFIINLDVVPKTLLKEIQFDVKLIPSKKRQKEKFYDPTSGSYFTLLTNAAKSTNCCRQIMSHFPRNLRVVFTEQIKKASY